MCVRRVNHCVFTIFSVALAVALSSGCGNIKKGKAPPLNEQAPEGAILVSQGQFSGTKVTGNAEVYRLSNDTLSIRLVSITTPEELGLKVIATENGETVFTASLKSFIGTQTYTGDLPKTRNLGSVIIRSSINIDYDQALLIKTQN